MNKILCYFIGVLFSFNLYGQDSTSNNYFPMGIWAQNGNVGIGTTSPNTKLEVNGELRVRLENLNYPTLNVAGIKSLGYSGITGAQNWTLRGVYQYTNGVSLNSAGGDLDLIKSLDGNTILATKANGIPLGNVGIGTTSPDQRLTVNGHYRLTGDQYFGTGSNSSNNWVFHTPDDGRKTLYIAPWNYSDTAPNWNWNKGIALTENGQLHLKNSLILRNGNNSNSYSNDQIEFAWAGSINYRHSIKSRHDSGKKSGNAVDFYVWNYGVDQASEIGSKKVMTLNGEGRVGIGTDLPGKEIEIRGGDDIGIRIFNEVANFWDITNSQYGKLDFLRANVPVMRLDQFGNVGIGTTTSQTRLEVKSHSSAIPALTISQFSSQGDGATIRYNNGYTQRWVSGMEGIAPSGRDFVIREENSGETFRFGQNGDFHVENGGIYSSGRVRIGTTEDHSEYNLIVGGKVLTEKVVVRKQANWPDFVFEKSYDLPSLTDVEKYIQNNKHLPEIPSASEVEKDGQDLAEMNRLLLKKVEELTLYLIEIEKKNKEQDELISQLLKK